MLSWLPPLRFRPEVLFTNDQSVTSCSGAPSTVTSHTVADLSGRHPVDRTPPFPLPYLSSPSRPSFPSPFPCPRLWCDFRPVRNQKLLTRRLKIGEKYQGAAARSFPSPRTSALPRSPSCGIRLNRLCLPKRLRSRRRNPVTLRAGSHPLNLSTATERPPSWT